ncbi:hypothetical protein HY504_01890 [Candidatus Wolfebacteria bacterium]|nr:hypothetical protein [Candidatus Wolfebacteria bacterium]
MGTQTLIRKLNQRQDQILEEMRQIKVKMRALGSLRRFEDLAKKGRKFAKEKGISRADVLRND